MLLSSFNGAINFIIQQLVCGNKITFELIVNCFVNADEIVNYLVEFYNLLAHLQFSTKFKCSEIV